jgi:signal peptidase II
MTRSVRVLLILAIMCSCVGCDQATKAIARERLPDGTTISMFHGTVRLERTENIGAFLSLGASLPKNVRLAFFTFGGLLLVTSGILWTLFARRMNPVQTVGAALACAGGLGNVIDRLIQSGQVTDFLNIGIGSFRTGIFNVADMVLMLGAALLLVPYVRNDSRHRPANGG